MAYSYHLPGPCARVVRGPVRTRENDRVLQHARRFFERLSAIPLFARIGPAIVPRLDRAVHRLSGGRFMLGQAVVPSLMLTTTGRKSGLERVTPLACLPEDDGTFLVVGSNFGRESHPSWTANLLAEPRATVSYQHRDVAVTGVLLEGEDRAVAWKRIRTVWPNYDAYEQRAGRVLRLFRLVPDSATD
jgi:deazaflavin-dependent oxidoreductase (nitroreductase family)